MQTTGKKSAHIVFSTVFEFYQPKSLVDIGCGLGHWLTVAHEHFGIENYMGVDGNYVKEEEFLIPKENFKRHNLENELTGKKEFDLCMSIETGEHLPEANASTFVDTLTSFADKILFSGAAPFQRGVHHVNMNTPSYWAEKFALNEYLCFDIIRDKLWENEEVNCIYPQNILFFVKKGKENFLLDQGYEPTTNPQLKYHPRFVEKRLSLEGKGALKKMLRNLAY